MLTVPMDEQKVERCRELAASVATDVQRYIGVDGLHPNDPGYAFISSEVVKAITQSSYPAPQSSCAGMTIVP